jgi:hypothetical protein
MQIQVKYQYSVKPDIKNHSKKIFYPQQMNQIIIKNNELSFVISGYTMVTFFVSVLESFKARKLNTKDVWKFDNFTLKLKNPKEGEESQITLKHQKGEFLSLDFLLCTFILNYIKGYKAESYVE